MTSGFTVRAVAVALVGGLAFINIQSASAATTGLVFAGGCPESIGTPCVPGSNATEANVALLLGLDESLVTFIGEDSGAGGPGFSVTGNGTTSGTWSVTDPAITHLAFKSNGYYILGEVVAAGGDWMNDTSAVGGWDISLVDCPAAVCGVDRAYVTADFLNNGGEVAALSNARAFAAIPVPAAVWLFGSALGLLGWVRRRAI
jgi:hypothetical protein